jgi:eukaryotic-like serine/threonine-protein kinase
VPEPTFGSYEIVSELGSGTLATVYKAIQQPIGRKVAIKALKPTILPDSSFAAPLEREARVLADLMHPNVVTMLDFVKTKEQMYLVLEYISGFSLAQVLAKKVKLRPEVAAAIGAEVARALEHVHDRGVVHRDIKPANVIVGKRGNVKVVDFGIAHRDRLPTADEPLTDNKEPLFGTPAYMAPEQLLGDVVSPASDLFSLGVVLYQCMAGIRPFDKEGALDAADKRATGFRTRRDPPVPLRTRVPDMPRSLERLVMGCLEKSPDDRPASARLVAQELEAFVRSRTEATHAELALSALALARLRAADTGKAHAIVQLEPTMSWQSPWTLSGATLLLALGFGAIRYAARNDPATTSTLEGSMDPALQLAGEVRVLATPWAEVAVDGQPIDVTPMARPIRLAPGAHYVLFTHPAAPPETRRVVIEPGQSVVLDVTMGVAFEQDAGVVEGGSR